MWCGYPPPVGRKGKKLFRRQTAKGLDDTSKSRTEGKKKGRKIQEGEKFPDVEHRILWRRRSGNKGTDGKTDRQNFSLLGPNGGQIQGKRIKKTTKSMKGKFIVTRGFCDRGGGRGLKGLKSTTGKGESPLAKASKRRQINKNKRTEKDWNK